MIMYMCVFAYKMYGIDLAGASAITACFPDARHILCHWHIQRYHKFFSVKYSTRCMYYANCFHTLEHGEESYMHVQRTGATLRNYTPHLFHY